MKKPILFSFFMMATGSFTIQAEMVVLPQLISGGFKK